jgi:hypothetical protein
VRREGGTNGSAADEMPVQGLAQVVI